MPKDKASRITRGLAVLEPGAESNQGHAAGSSAGAGSVQFNLR